MSVRWTVPRAAAVAGGGVAGAACRWALLGLITTGSHFPWPLLIVNVAGSVVLGVVMAEGWRHPRARLMLHDALGIGFCGGLTTFSTFAVQLVDLADAHRTTIAVAYGLASVVLSLMGVVAGATVLRRVQALRAPLEGEL